VVRDTVSKPSIKKLGVSEVLVCGVLRITCGSTVSNSSWPQSRSRLRKASPSMWLLRSTTPLPWGDVGWLCSDSPLIVDRGHSLIETEIAHPSPNVSVFANLSSRTCFCPEPGSQLEAMHLG